MEVAKEVLKEYLETKMIEKETSGERRKFDPFTADLMLTSSLHQCVIKQLLNEVFS